jgi:hypothetical protein
MSEINESRTANTGNRRPNRTSTRVDLTPMVDLGFLLITFFMLTTVLAKPTILAMVMPDRKAPPEILDEVPQSKVLTLLLGEDDKIYWYEGITDPALDSTDYSAGGLRRVILRKMDRVREQWGEEPVRNPVTETVEGRSFLYVLIKPLPGARYRNLVDVIDEMAINRVRYYVIMDPSLAEREFVRRPAAGLAWK